MKWLAQLKIQERGRAVALKEAAAAAVRGEEKKQSPPHQQQEACDAHEEQVDVLNTCKVLNCAQVERTHVRCVQLANKAVINDRSL